MRDYNSLGLEIYLPLGSGNADNEKCNYYKELVIENILPLSSINGLFLCYSPTYYCMTPKQMFSTHILCKNESFPHGNTENKPINNNNL